MHRDGGRRRRAEGGRVGRLELRGDRVIADGERVDRVNSLAGRPRPACRARSAPSKNSTLPAAPAPLTVAVSVTSLPARAVSGDAASVVVVATGPDPPHRAAWRCSSTSWPSAENVTNVDCTYTNDVTLALHWITNSKVSPPPLPVRCPFHRADDRQDVAHRAASSAPLNGLGVISADGTGSERFCWCHVVVADDRQVRGGLEASRATIGRVERRDDAGGAVVRDERAGCRARSRSAGSARSPAPRPARAAPRRWWPHRSGRPAPPCVSGGSLSSRSILAFCVRGTRPLRSPTRSPCAGDLRGSVSAGAIRQTPNGVPMAEARSARPGWCVGSNARRLRRHLAARVAERRPVSVAKPKLRIVERLATHRSTSADEEAGQTGVEVGAARGDPAELDDVVDLTGDRESRCSARYRSAARCR